MLRCHATLRKKPMTRVTTTFAVVALLVGVAGPAVAQEGSIGIVDTETGEWYLRDPSNGATTRFFYGDPGDLPMVGDWDCDGDETPGLYRQSDGFVYLRNSNDQGVADIRFFFGNPRDVPLAGDFNNDGCDTVSIYRPSEGRVYIINDLGANDGGLGPADFSYVFGNPGDKPYVGDFDSDGIDEVGLHRESTGLVYFRFTHTQGVADHSFIFGDPRDKIVAAKWAGTTGPESVGLFRPSTCTIYLRYTNTQGVADETISYGMRSGLPVAGDFGTLPGGGSPPSGCSGGSDGSGGRGDPADAGDGYSFIIDDLSTGADWWRAPYLFTLPYASGFGWGAGDRISYGCIYGFLIHGGTLVNLGSKNSWDLEGGTIYGRFTAALTVSGSGSYLRVNDGYMVEGRRFFDGSPGDGRDQLYSSGFCDTLVSEGYQSYAGPGERPVIKFHTPSGEVAEIRDYRTTNAGDGIKFRLVDGDGSDGRVAVVAYKDDLPGVVVYYDALGGGSVSASIED